MLCRSERGDAEHAVRVFDADVESESRAWRRECRVKSVVPDRWTEVDSVGSADRVLNDSASRQRTKELEAHKSMLNSSTVSPACRMMALSVPLSSVAWSGTTTRSGGSRRLRMTWLPCCRCTENPALRSAAMQA